MKGKIESRLWCHCDSHGEEHNCILVHSVQISQTKIQKISMREMSLTISSASLSSVGNSDSGI